MKYYKAGTEVRILLTYTDQVSLVERVRIKHGIVTSVSNQDSMSARIGHYDERSLTRIDSRTFQVGGQAQ